MLRLIGHDSLENVGLGVHITGCVATESQMRVIFSFKLEGAEIRCKSFLHVLK
jgi:hypothetical protein